MVTEQDVRLAAERIAKVAGPCRIIVFGSYGRGDADAASDLDIMVIEPDIADRHLEMVRLHGAVGDIGTGVDVLVYSLAEANRRGQVPGTVVYWALKQGRVLHDALP